MIKKIMSAFLLAVLILPIFVYAQANTGESQIAKTLKGGFEGLFEVINYIFGLKFMTGDDKLAQQTVLIRCALFFLIFTLITAGARKINFPTGVSVAIGITIALLGTFTIGDKTIQYIGGTYGFLTSFILLLIPLLLLGGILIMLPTNGRIFIGLKIVCVIVLLILSSQFTLVYSSTPQTSSNELPDTFAGGRQILGGAAVYEPLTYQEYCMQNPYDTRCT